MPIDDQSLREDMPREDLRILGSRRRTVRDCLVPVEAEHYTDLLHIRLPYVHGRMGSRKPETGRNRHPATSSSNDNKPRRSNPEPV